MSDSPEAITFSWEFTTTAVTVPGMKATACITIDSRTADPTALQKLEDALYGTNVSTTNVAESPYLPMPSELVEMFQGE